MTEIRYVDVPAMSFQQEPGPAPAFAVDTTYDERIVNVETRLGFTGTMGYFRVWIARQS